MVRPSLEYVLTATPMSEPQGEKIVRKLHRSILPELGANRQFPILWHHCIPKYQGLGMLQPNFAAGCKHLATLATFSTSTELLGGLIRANVEQATLELGRSTSLFATDPTECGNKSFTRHCWLGSSWDFASRHGVSVELPCNKPPPLQREGDVPLIELFEDCNGNMLTKYQYASLQRCRRHLELYFLSDLVTGDGRKICRVYFNASSHTAPPEASRWDWGREKPTRQDWVVWHSSLQQISSSTLTLPPARRLGHWLVESHKQYEWKYCLDTDRLFQFDPAESQWKIFARRSHTTRSAIFRYHRDSPVAPPDTSQCAIVDKMRQGVSLTGYAPLLTLPPLPPVATPARLLHSIRELGKEGWPLTVSDFSSAPLLVTSIQRGNAYACSDGSYMSQRSLELGTAAWGLRDPVSGQTVKGCLCTSGTRAEVNTYRSELQSVHTLLLALWVICDPYGITTGSVTVGCDNDKCIDLSSAAHLDISVTSYSHVDLIRAI